MLPFFLAEAKQLLVHEGNHGVEGERWEKGREHVHVCVCLSQSVCCLCVSFSSWFFCSGLLLLAPLSSQAEEIPQEKE